MAKSGSKVKKIKRFIFLKDVMVIALTAFGGPSMHIALFQKRMVEKKGYLTTEELLELYSLAQMLPGPSSTQTITSMGYRFGGPVLAFLTLIIWMLPAVVLMTSCAFLFVYLDPEVTRKTFRFIEPLAVAFVVTAGISMAKKVSKGSLRIILMIMAFVVVALLRHPLEEYVKSPWMFPIVLIGGAVISYFLSKQDAELVKNEQEVKSKIVVKWTYLVVFSIIFILAGVMAKFGGSNLFVLFENMYRFGSLVFGGGNVLVPMMFDQFVQFHHWMRPDEFLTGIGLNQAVPGPIFSISAFIGGMVMREYGTVQQVLASFVAAFGIFLPGTLMIFFVYPMWDSIKQYKIIRRSLDGVIAASTGLVLAAGYLLFLPVGFEWIEPNSFHFSNLQQTDYVNYGNIGLVIVLSILLTKLKVPTPIWVILAILAGIFL